MILLVIDVQKGITDSRIYDYEGFLARLQQLIRTARDHQVEVIYFQHDDGPGTGFSVGDEIFEIADEVAPAPGEKVFIKTICSCFGNREFAAYMEQQEEKSLMIVGLQTNYCIDATVKSAFEKGFRVIIPEGTNSTFDNDYMDKETTVRYYNELVWPGNFAEVVPMEEALGLLAGAK